MAANDFVSNLVLDAAMTPELSEREKALRDMFVQEYMHDFDHIAAALRCGFMRSFAKEYADKFMQEPYVQQQIQMRKLVTAVPGTESSVNEELYNKRRVFSALMQEAHYHGAGATHSGRITALSKLATILGMDKPQPKDEDNANSRGGVMRIPSAVSLDDWEDAAVVSQAALVQHART